MKKEDFAAGRRQRTPCGPGLTSRDANNLRLATQNYISLKNKVERSLSPMDKFFEKHDVMYAEKHADVHTFLNGHTKWWETHT